MWGGYKRAMDDMHADAFIDMQQVSYVYTRQQSSDRGEQVQALRDINLRVRQGEYVVVLGHNGSGKSTLARHCNALLLPDDGRVLVSGLDTRDTSKQRTIRERVG